MCFLGLGGKCFARKQLLECKGRSFLLLLVFGDGVPDEFDGWLIIK
jgi:hypothetical protein